MLLSKYIKRKHVKELLIHLHMLAKSMNSTMKTTNKKSFLLIKCSYKVNIKEHVMEWLVWFLLREKEKNIKTWCKYTSSIAYGWQKENPSATSLSVVDNIYWKARCWWSECTLHKQKKKQIITIQSHYGTLFPAK